MVELIIKKLSEGASVDDLLISYLHLKKEEIFAALQSEAAMFAKEMSLA